MVRAYKGVKFQTGRGGVSRRNHDSYVQRQAAANARAALDKPEHLRLTRKQVRAEFCPACLAKPGQLCQDRRREPRQANHIERVRLALEKADQAAPPAKPRCFTCGAYGTALWKEGERLICGRCRS